MKKLTVLALLALLPVSMKAQLTGQSSNYISTGMPILLIAPDAVSSGLGDAGVASTPDIYSAHWNNAKFAFIDGKMGIGTTYTPWLRNLRVNDMNLLYLSGYYRINDNSVAAAGLTYFTLGKIIQTDADGNQGQEIYPNEFAIDATYALKLTDQLSLGATVRYLRSDLTNGVDIEDGGAYKVTEPANSVAADVGLYYTTDIDDAQELALGAFVSNLGAKLSYSSDDTDKEFLPANLRLGGRYTNRIDEYNKVSVLFDVNKLLVPTPPLRGDTTTSWFDYNNIGVMQGVFQSFYDAPGGLSEEVHEMQFSVGAEYWYAETFAARMGYFYEHESKGGRRYLTFGFGIRYNMFNFDFSYLLPTTKLSASPLTNTIRLSIGINL